MCPDDVYIRNKLHDYCADFSESSAIFFCNYFRSHVSSTGVCWRFLFTLLLSLIPVAIVGATRFYTTFVDILSELSIYSDFRML